MNRFLISCVAMQILGRVAIGSVFDPVLAIEPFLVVGIDYNEDRGVSPMPRLDLAKLNGITITSSDGSIPWREIVPGGNGRDFVIDATIKIAGKIAPGHVIDLHNQVYSFREYESTYHTYWTASPVDDQYGVWNSWQCFPGENRCQVSGKTKLGEAAPVLTPYYLGGGDAYDDNFKWKGAKISMAFDPIHGGRYARASRPVNNDGKIPPLTPIDEIRILPHPDGVQTWLQMQAGNELHAITLRTSRPLSTWAEVDDWAMRIKERSGLAVTEHWVNGTPYRAHNGYVSTPEPSCGDAAARFGDGSTATLEILGERSEDSLLSAWVSSDFGVLQEVATDEHPPK